MAFAIEFGSLTIFELNFFLSIFLFDFALITRFHFFFRNCQRINDFFSILIVRVFIVLSYGVLLLLLTTLNFRRTWRFEKSNEFMKILVFGF